MADRPKVHTKRVTEPDSDPYYYERNYFPSALIGKALGLHPKDPKPNREAKRDRERVGLSDIREKYRRKESD